MPGEISFYGDFIVARWANQTLFGRAAKLSLILFTWPFDEV